MGGSNTEEPKKQDVLSPTADGISGLIVRVLEQLSISAWLPAAFFAASVAVLERFNANRQVSLGRAVSDFAGDPFGFLVLLVPLLVVVTMVTQAFSFLAIRALEGYWRGWGPIGLLRSALIRRQLQKKSAFGRRRMKATKAAFAIARPRMLEAGLDHSIVNYLELEAHELTGSEEGDRPVSARMSWRSHCDPWRLAKINALIKEEKRYPYNRRVMPTKLGNVLRAAEDSLKLQEGEELQGWVIRRKDLMPPQLRVDHDHFRARLDMYAILVFISALMTAVTPLALVGAVSDWWMIAITTTVFAAISVTSYHAAVASAEGYGGILKEVNRRALGDS